MTLLGRSAVVTAGYVAAFALGTVAAVVFNSRIPPDAQSSHGMLAFSEMMVFLFAFSAAALVPTGAALYWLRPVAGLWAAMSRLALVVAVTSVGAAILVAFDLPGATLSVLRLLVTPLLGAGFALCAALAPDRASRSLLSLAAAMEGAGAAYAFVHWFAPLYFS